MTGDAATDWWTVEVDGVAFDGVGDLGIGNSFNWKSTVSEYSKMLVSRKWGQQCYT